MSSITIRELDAGGTGNAQHRFLVKAAWTPFSTPDKRVIASVSRPSPA